MRLKIEVHALLHNEALILPYFIRHYQRFAKIFFYESDSTDNSLEIAKKLSTNIIPLPTGNQVNDEVFTDMKNNCWKNSDADWVIVCDPDEFVYHPDLIHILENTEFTIFKPDEWRMYSREFPTTTGQIYDEVKYGVPGFPQHNKMILFRPSEIKEMNYCAGCHAGAPVGNVNICDDSEILTLHYHDLGVEYRVARNKYLGSRLSEINKLRGWGSHLLVPEDVIRKNFEDDYKNIVQVVF